ncbi:MAG: PAS domain S-box protein [Deltaproteobacteria bacterium]|nr:PAS domain S-box protein [Deltaproteobacteria bacterium]
MTAKSKKDRLESILHALKKAAAGDYSQRLDSASQDDDLGRIADAVNKLLKKTEKRLRASPPPTAGPTDEARRYRHILDTIEESYFEVDLGGNLKFFNDAMVRELGYSHDELSGINYRNLVDEDSSRKVYEAFHRVFLTGISIKGFDWQILKKNKDKLSVEASVALMCDESGNPIGFRGVVRDVSLRVRIQNDLAENEERYRTILDIVEEGYLESSLAGRITFVSDAACRLMGYTGEQLIGMHYKRYLTPAVARKMEDLFQRVYRTGEPERLFDYDLVRKDGSVITYEISTALKHDASGKPSGFRILTRDVSWRKRAEHEKRVSEEKYRTILEIMGEGYFETDIHGITTFVNDAGCALVGYEREDLIGTFYDHYTTEESLATIKDVYRKIFRNELATATLDYEVITKNGSIRFHQQNVALMRDETGRPSGFRVLVRDVTERRRAEESLRRSEEKYRHILENMEETYLETDLRGNFLFFNDSLCHTLGYSREELQKANYKLIVPSDTVQSTFEAFNQIYRTGLKKTLFEHAIMTKQGQIIYTEVSISLMRSPQGDPIGFSAIGRDVTRRLQNERIIQDREKRLRMITDNISDIIWTMDFNLRWTYLSPSCLRILGFSPEEVLGIPLQAMLPPETYTLVEERLARELAREAAEIPADGPRTATFEVPLLHRNGTEVWVEVSANFNRDENGKPVEIVGVTRVITERKKAQKALEESEAIYRKTLESTSDGVTIVQDGRYVYYNEQFLRTLGIPKASRVGGEPLGSLVHPDDVQIIKEAYTKNMRGEPTPNNFDIRVIRPDGKLLHLLVTSVDTVYKGKPAVLSFMQDITERKDAENALLESEKRYRTMTENVNDIVWVVDFDLRITYVSPSNLRLTGFAPEEVRNKPLEGFITPDSLALASRILAEELAEEASGRPVDPKRSRMLQIEMYSKSSENIWMEVNATLNRDPNGKATEILAVGRDITQRRNMEKALAESEQRYRTIVENMRDSISILDLNLHYIYQSPSEVRVTGHTPEEIMAIPIRDQLTPESYARAEGVLAEELRREFSGAPVDPHRMITLELEAYHKKGGTIWQEVNAIFERDKSGKPIGIILTARDITARRSAEIALAESERLYRMIVENMQDVIWILDLNLQYKYRSPSASKASGYTIEEIISTPPEKQMTPESFARARSILLEELEREQSGLPFDPRRSRTVEIEVYKKEGGTVWLEATASFNRDREGKPTEIQIAARDISARKKVEAALKDSEKRYRMIIENMKEVVWTTDLNLQFTYMSPSCFPLTGYTPDELIALPINKLLMPESLTLATNAVMEELALEDSTEVADPNRSRTLEQEILCKNGDTVWIEVTATFMRNAQGKATRILMAGRDLTASKKARADKDRLEAQLMQAQKMEIVGRLAGGVAHDFNNMLSVILGYVDLAKLRLGKQHPILKDIAEIEKAAIRSRDITTQLLAFSRKQVIEPKIVDLNDLVAHTQKALIRLIGEDIGLHVIMGENLWPIKFDPSQVEQILINLAVNARDAMPGGGQLTIETVNIALDESFRAKNIDCVPGQYVRLSFSDNGVGMDKETLQHIFEPFFTTKDVGKGTGLGLATVYGIVKQNDGFVNVYSEPDHGTTFSIFLPRAEGECALPAEPEPEEKIAGSGNILLVEDDAMVLQITKGILESLGYRVTSIEKPMEAVEYCRDPDVCVDLVISDVVMPGISGKELRNKIMEIRPDINMIFMSGYTADVIAHHGVLEEGVQFIQKPFTIKSLAAKVTEALAGKKNI